jgi:hypothetical protein
VQTNPYDVIKHFTRLRVARACECGNVILASKNAENFLTSSRPVSLSGMTLLHVVSILLLLLTVRYCICALRSFTQAQSDECVTCNMEISLRGPDSRVNPHTARMTDGLVYQISGQNTRIYEQNNRNVTVKVNLSLVTH